MSKDSIQELEKPKRIHQIAKELNISHVEILDFLKEKKYSDKKALNLMTKIDSDVYSQIMVKFHPEKILAKKKEEYKSKRMKLKESEGEIVREVVSVPVTYMELKKSEKSIEVSFIEKPPKEAKKDVGEVKQKAEKEVAAGDKKDKRRISKKKEADAVVAQAKEIISKGAPDVQTEKVPEAVKGSATDERRRRLSKEGKKIAEKIREKQDKPGDVKDIDAAKPDKKRRRKKAYKKKKVDEKEVDAPIKETCARMDAGKIRKKYKKARDTEEDVEESNLIKVSEYISASELAELMSVEANEVIKKCMEMGLMVTINQRLDYETIAMVADEFGFEIELLEEYGIDVIEEDEEEENEEDLEERSPIVTIMGHVDHGKTSLLDFIRKSNVVAGEIGNITQHIGAYEVEYNEKQLAFLDTPGHEAFTAMRARGAQVTDIVILIVAADDSVMPQTVEAINHAKSAQVPIIIAINKIDKPNADIDAIKKQLADRDVLVEDWGGHYPCVEISAKTGQGIDSLLEIILIQAELLELKANHKKPARGVVIESKLDKGRGAVATVLIRNGTLKVSDSFISGEHWGKVRAMFNERGKKIKTAPPSTPVQVLGFSGVPQAGDRFVVLESERESRSISLKRQQLKREQEYRKIRHLTLDEISRQIKFGVVRELSIIVKADTDGSAEALSDSLMKISSPDNRVVVNIVHKGVGSISESDVLLASAAGAIIIGFHVRPNTKGREIAEKEKVDIRTYTIIYDVIDDVKKALEGMLEPEFKEEVTGSAVVREVFKVSKYGTIAGSYIESGKISRNDRVRLIRDGKVIYEGKLSSLKRFKDDAKEVLSGFECGIGIENYNDIKNDDVIEAFKTVEIKRTIEL